MKRKLLSFVLLALGCMGAWADDETWYDITSSYVTNASYDGYISQNTKTATPCSGWTGSSQYSSFNYQIASVSDGKIVLSDGTSLWTSTLTTTTATIPAGTYKMTIEYAASATQDSFDGSTYDDGNVYINLGDTKVNLAATSNDGTYSTGSVTTTTTEAGTLSLVIGTMWYTTTAVKRFGFGNCRLYYQGTQAEFETAVANMTDKSSLSALYTKASNLYSYSTQGNGAFQYSSDTRSTFNNAITEAKKVIDNSTSQTDIDNAVTTLQNAIDAFILKYNAPAAGTTYALQLNGGAYLGKAPALSNTPSAVSFEASTTKSGAWNMMIDGQYIYYNEWCPRLGTTAEANSITLANGGWTITNVESETANGWVMGSWKTGAGIDTYYYQNGGTYTLWSITPLMAESTKDYTAGTTGIVAIDRTIAAGSYATVCFPVAVDVPTGLNVYTLSTASNNDGTVNLSFAKKSDATSFAAGTAYLVYNSTDADITINKVETGVSFPAEPTATYTDNVIAFVGTYKAGNVANGNFFISNNNKFTKNNGATVSINGFRAYFAVKNSTAVKAINFIVDDDNTTAISAIANDSASASAEYYTLSGARIAAPQRGINIVKMGNTVKKIMVK